MNLINSRGLLFCVLFFLFFSVVLPVPVASGSLQVKVFVVPIKGEVGPSMAAFIQRVFRDASGSPDSFFILEMDTFGGRVDSALQIVDVLLDISRRKTIAFVRNKAISAGALIALACHELVMRPNTTIGDCAPITYANEGPKMMGEKFQSPLRAKFRTLAKRNGYPQVLAESMVTAEMEVYQVEMNNKIFYMDSLAFTDLTQKEKEKVISKKTVVAKGQLLTMDDKEALHYGFSKMSVSNIEDMFTQMGIDDYEIIRLEKNWSERLGALISSIAPVLMIIGLAALYIELRAPGFGIPGITGILCLGLVFLNQYLVGLADYTELLLIVLGIALLGMEIFVIPGFGMAGISGLICIGAGMILSFQDFIVPDPSFPWQKEILTENIIQILGSFIAAFIISLLFLRYIFPRLETIVEGPYLSTTLANSRAQSEDVRMLHVGNSGVAMTFLRPTGKARFGNEMHDVLTEGEFIEKDTPLVVAAIKGNRIIVARKEPQ